MTDNDSIQALADNLWAYFQPKIEAMNSSATIKTGSWMSHKE